MTRRRSAAWCGALARLSPSCRLPPHPVPAPAVASALGRFSWPVYQCVLPLLTAVAQEGVRRGALGPLSPPASAALLESALASARALNPRIGVELEAQVAGWQAQARLATGNSILRFPSEAAPASAAAPAAAPGAVPAPALQRAHRC